MGGHEYRIDELARETETTVRNIRAYQDRGLLPSPRRTGRVGLYSDEHRARLHLIGSLLERGYTLSNIGELLAAWEEGRDLSALLGLEAVLAAPWDESEAPLVTLAELETWVGRDDPDGSTLSWAIALGILEPVASEGSTEAPATYRILNRSAIEVAAALQEADVPMEVIAAAGARMREDIDDIARHFVDLVDLHAFGAGERMSTDIPSDDLVAKMAHLVEILRPLAKQVVDRELSRAMERHIRVRLGERVAEIARGVGAEGTHDAS